MSEAQAPRAVGRPGFPWQASGADHWLAEGTRYSDLGPEECARQLTALAGVPVTPGAVMHRGSGLGLRVSTASATERRVAGRYGCRPGRASKPPKPPSAVPASHRRVCMKCGIFALREGATECPRCHARVSRANLDYPLLPVPAGCYY
jgi:hypothetical protein